MKYIRKVSDIHLDVDISRSGYSGEEHRHGGWDPVVPFSLVGKTKEEIAYLTKDPMEVCWTPPPMEGDDDTCLIIAGDLWTERKFLERKFRDGESWMAKVAKQFKHVVFVLGNHDYWRTNALYEPQKVRDEITKQNLTNVHFLEKSMVVLDQVKFVGGTLWTDYKRHDPQILYMATSVMNDYSKMRWGNTYGKCLPQHMYEIHQNTKSFIFENVTRDTPDQKIVVVTHMAPSFQSIHPIYHQEPYTNFYYYSDLEQRIKQDGKDIDFWFHGHVHHHFEYLLEPNVRVIANPRGYAGYESQEFVGFKPNFRIEL